MNKHTPGPWKVDYDFGSDRPEIRSYDERLVSVCARQYPMSQKTCEANARLIAAAPELLQILQELEFPITMDFGDEVRHLCKICNSFDFEGHTPSCKLGNILKKVES